MDRVVVVLAAVCVFVCKIFFSLSTLTRWREREFWSAFLLFLSGALAALLYFFYLLLPEIAMSFIFDSLWDATSRRSAAALLSHSYVPQLRALSLRLKPSLSLSRVCLSRSLLLVPSNSGRRYTRQERKKKWKE